MTSHGHSDALSIHTEYYIKQLRNENQPGALFIIVTFINIM
jgi:folate-dependent tRNA-U54 methylase TrmFO/GidA